MNGLEWFVVAFGIYLAVYTLVDRIASAIEYKKVLDAYIAGFQVGYRVDKDGFYGAIKPGFEKISGQK